MKVAVVGHVEWVRVRPGGEPCPLPGRDRPRLETWEEPAGGGAVAAVQLARLAGVPRLLHGARVRRASAPFPRRARAKLGVDVQAIPRRMRPARAFTYRRRHRRADDHRRSSQKLRPRGGDSRLPWHELARDGRRLLRQRRRRCAPARRAARVLVATARELATLQEAGVELDALVGSGRTRAELYQPGDLDPAPQSSVTTAGGLGGWLQPGGPFRSAPLPGPVVDTYGAGDCFAAGLTFAPRARGRRRGRGRASPPAAARRCMTGQGPYARPNRRRGPRPLVAREIPFRGGQVGEGGLKWGEVVISPDPSNAPRRIRPHTR